MYKFNGHSYIQQLLGLFAEKQSLQVNLHRVVIHSTNIHLAQAAPDVCKCFQSNLCLQKHLVVDICHPSKKRFLNDSFSTTGPF